MMTQIKAQSILAWFDRYRASRPRWQALRDALMSEEEVTDTPLIPGDGGRSALEQHLDDLRCAVFQQRCRDKCINEPTCAEIEGQPWTCPPCGVYVALAAVRAPEPPQQEQQGNHGPTLQEQKATIADHYGNGWRAGKAASAEPPQLPQNDYAKRLLLDETPWPKAASDAINALQSIARNSCCSPCREAALVAQAALDQVSSPARSTPPPPSAECPICKAAGGLGVMNCAHMWKPAPPPAQAED